MKPGKMKRFLSFFPRNLVYIIISVFLILEIVLPLVIHKGGKKDGQKVLESSPQREEKKTLRISPDDIRAREEKIKLLASENPKLYLFLSVFNALIVFVFFLGVFLDIYFLRRFVSNNPIKFTPVNKAPPLWGIGDIFRVTVIFIFLGYIFLVLQSYAVKFMPIFGNDNFRMVMGTLLMNIAGISLILHFVIRKYGQGVSEIGISPCDIGKNIFYSVTAYISILPVIFTVMVITFFVIKVFNYEPPMQPIVQVFLEEKETGVLWFSAIFAAVFGPVAEEIFFRGFMYPAIKARIGVISGLIITSAIFAILHAHIVGFFPIFVLGILLAYLYEKTGSLTSSIGVHIMHNLSMVILVFIMRGVGV